MIHIIIHHMYYSKDEIKIQTEEFPFLLKVVVDLDFRYFSDKLLNNDIKI